MGRHTVTLTLTDEEYESLLNRVAYLQARRPGSKVSKADAIRQALLFAYSFTTEKETNSSNNG